MNMMGGNTMNMVGSKNMNMFGTNAMNRFQNRPVRLNNQRFMNRRNGLITNRNTGSNFNALALSEQDKDNKDEDYDEYLDEYSYTTADAAVDATNSKYEVGMMESTNYSGGNRRMGVDVSGNRGFGLYGGTEELGHRQGYAGGYSAAGGAFGNWGAKLTFRFPNRSAAEDELFPLELLEPPDCFI